MLSEGALLVLWYQSSPVGDLYAHPFSTEIYRQIAYIELYHE
jgi:hypothetical protein